MKISTYTLGMGFCCLMLTSALLAKSSPIKAPTGPVPVVDAQALANMGSQLSDLDKQLDTLNNQYEELKYLHNDLNGFTKINGDSVGDLLNSLNTIQSSWMWTKDDWQSTLKSFNGGDNGPYQNLTQAYQSQYPALSAGNLQQDHVNNDNRQIYQQAVNVNGTVMAQSAYQFNDINNQVKSIEDLTNDINNVQTDKASTDLNSRLVAQLAYIQLAMLRMQTLSNQQISEARAADLADEKANIEFTSHEIGNP